MRTDEADPRDRGSYLLGHDPHELRRLGLQARVIDPITRQVDWTASSSIPPAPIWDATCLWVSDTIRRSGAETRGTNAYGTFKRAGLGAPTMRLEAVVGSGEHPEPIDLLTNLARTVAEAAEAYGITTIREIDIETLHERLRVEAAATDSVLIAHTEVGAWVRL